MQWRRAVPSRAPRQRRRGLCRGWRHSAGGHGGGGLHHLELRVNDAASTLDDCGFVCTTAYASTAPCRRTPSPRTGRRRRRHGPAPCTPPPPRTQREPFPAMLASYPSSLLAQPRSQPAPLAEPRSQPPPLAEPPRACRLRSPSCALSRRRRSRSRPRSRRRSPSRLCSPSHALSRRVALLAEKTRTPEREREGRGEEEKEEGREYR
uniref:Uncharacterized protein n=1 Tax=Oryza sativa subsp. japonica TaxID=39947 RepID=Q6K3X5_ORYSJ|nr:hypothetical protein [Oryza sativa Japonica Group]